MKHSGLPAVELTDVEAAKEFIAIRTRLWSWVSLSQTHRTKLPLGLSLSLSLSLSLLSMMYAVLCYKLLCSAPGTLC